METMTNREVLEYFPSIFDFLKEGLIESFTTAKSALAEAKKYGRHDVIKIEKRFETIYVVGKKSFMPEAEMLDGKVFAEFDTIDLPELKFYEDEFGTLRQDIFTVRKPYGRK